MYTYHCFSFERKIYSSDLFRIGNSIPLRIVFLELLSVLRVILNESMNFFDEYHLVL